MKNKIVVTGGAGFVGSNLIKFLINKTKYNIISIDNYSSGSKKNHVKNERVTYINGHTKDISKILNKYKDWSANVLGDEQREKLIFKHDRLNIMGFQNHSTVLKNYNKTSIAVVCSRWNEPFGRTSLEAASRGCAVIISNRGGLPETISDGITLGKLLLLYRLISSLK